MDIEKIKAIIRRKPPFFLFTSIGYLLITALLKWGVRPTIDTMLYLLGGLVGVYFLDIAEIFFHLNPSPFRSMVFIGGFVIISLFVTTSSMSYEAIGLVLSLYLTLVLWQVGQWQAFGNLQSWYQMISGTVPVSIQRTILIFFVIIFLFETGVFIR